MEKSNVVALEKADTVAVLAEAANKTALDDKVLNQAALEATADDHELTIAEAIRVYPKAIGWALVSSTCVIMEGYDTNLLSNFFAYPSFLIKYGRFVGVTPQSPTGYQLTPAWQAGLSQGAGVGSIFGCLLSGYLVSKYGSRRVQIGALIALSLFIFPVFFAPNLIGTELRRTEIACVVFAGQILCGIAFAYNSSYFFSQMGLGTSTTYSLALGGTGLAFIGCLINWFVLMPRLGRRTIYVWGMAGMCSVLLLIGILNVWTSKESVAMAQACLTMLWTFIFQLSAGQLGWALPAEVGSTRLRQKTICLARDSSNIMGTIGGVLQQYFMNPQAWNLKGYTGFFWAGTCFGVFVWSYFRLPETWNRSYHELDVLFAKRVPARKFASTVVDPFDERDISEMTAKA
ncbi:general alpha-glucoside permease [Verticillium alfalfae VaMs.102]|uniref:General alpha-glucoside permease n=1 Tax=Verticillium alfalfae (strain VaMs.102 / ATCC MYA-4576 / FGSC 10136) TaxID=526221 RepID=C9SC40_VERA1|nr:general alpha-glucoside permease [Verticillium alfalfae VaMs.102]EEY15924.1 general alpha-glucoside permease [Verticillium alfalfae VaMs.102]